MTCKSKRLPERAPLFFVVKGLRLFFRLRQPQCKKEMGQEKRGPVQPASVPVVLFVAVERGDGVHLFFFQGEAEDVQVLPLMRMVA